MFNNNFWFTSACKKIVFFSNFQNFIFYKSLPRSLNENRSRPFHKPYLFDWIKLLSVRLANILKSKVNQKIRPKYFEKKLAET